MNGHLRGSPDLSMLPDAERQICPRALAKDPSSRWPSCRAFIRYVANPQKAPTEDHVETLRAGKLQTKQHNTALSFESTRSRIIAPTDKVPGGRTRLIFPWVLAVALLSVFALV